MGGRESMGNSYKALSDYLRFLRDRCGLQVCIKDFSGFIPINKELDEALQPFLAQPARSACT